MHDQSSLGSIHDHLSSFFSHFNVDTKQFCIEISCYFMNQNYGSLKRLFLKFDISFMFAQCAWNEFAHIHTQFFFHLITCLEQSKFVKANVLDQYDKETEIFFNFNHHSCWNTHTQIKLIWRGRGNEEYIYCMPFYNIY